MTNGDIIPWAMHVHTVFTSIRECKGDLRPATLYIYITLTIGRNVS